MIYPLNRLLFFSAFVLNLVDNYRRDNCGNQNDDGDYEKSVAGST